MKALSTHQFNISILNIFSGCCLQQQDLIINFWRAINSHGDSLIAWGVSYQVKCAGLRWHLTSSLAWSAGFQVQSVFRCWWQRQREGVGKEGWTSMLSFLKISLFQKNHTIFVMRINSISGHDSSTPTARVRNNYQALLSFSEKTSSFNQGTPCNYVRWKSN